MKADAILGFWKNSFLNRSIFAEEGPFFSFGFVFMHLVGEHKELKKTCFSPQQGNGLMSFLILFSPQVFLLFEKQIFDF